MSNLFHRLGNAFDAITGKTFALGGNEQPTRLFYSYGGGLSDSATFYPLLNSYVDIAKALDECPQVSTVLLRKSQAFSNGKIQIHTENGALVKQSSTYKVLGTPNIIQSDIQFRTQLFFYIQSYGFCPVLRIRPLGFNDVRSLWILPPDKVEITWTKDIPFYKTNIADLVDKIEVKIDSNQKLALNKEDIYFFTDTTGVMEKGYLPTSRLTSLRMPIGNLIKNYKSRGRLIEKPFGILSNEARDSISSLPLDPEEKERLYQEFTQYGTGDGKKDVILTDATLKWQMMMYPIEQMQFLDMQDTDTQVICDKIGYPHALLGNRKGTTFDNMDAADVQLYQNHIIPDAENISQQYTECLELDKQGKKVVITYDHITALQGDKKTASEARKIMGQALIAEYQAGLIPKERVLEILGEQPNQIGEYYVEPTPTTTDTQVTTNNNTGTNSGNQSNQGQNN